MPRGDVLRVELPTPSDRHGHEPAGTRPAIVVQSDASTATLPTLMVVPVTSQLGALRFPYTIRVEPSPMNGLASPSVLLVFQLRVIDRRALVGTMGRLESAYLEQLDSELRRLLAL